MRNAKKNCEACDASLEVDETIEEHVVAKHLTEEGKCEYCGEDSADFLIHIKIHAGVIKKRLVRNPYYEQVSLEEVSENSLPKFPLRIHAVEVLRIMMSMLMQKKSTQLRIV